MPFEGNKRQPRVPKTAEEIEELVLLKKIREHRKLEKFKKTKSYKFANIFNVICFFIYCELIFCFIGPCNYYTHYSKNISVERGDARNQKGEGITSVVKVTGVNGKQYNFMVNDFINKPAKFSSFELGKDFILQKELKGTISTSNDIYKIHQSSPLFFLSFFVAVFSCIIFSYNQNQNPHSLIALTATNAVTIIVFMLL
jgi:hypothetical protein